MMNRRELLISLAAAGNSVTAKVTARRPNVVVILADDMGYGDPSCYGGELATPNIDRLAHELIRFKHGYVASPVCSPSRVGITTGQCPARHLIFSYLDSRKRQRELGMKDYLDPKVPTLARTLKSAGYATGHFGKWHMGGGRDVDDAPLPAAYGFDESNTSFEGLGDRVLPPGKLSEASERLGHGKISHAPKDQLTQIYVDHALDFVGRNREKPLFVQLWPDDVHDPFEPRAGLFQKYRRYSKNKYRQQFYAVLDEFDRQIGRFVNGIGRLGLAENTIIVFLGDNGPTAWPRYYREGLQPPGSTGGLRGRKWSLYEGGIREPMMVRWKGHVPEGRVDSETVVSSLDLFPTLCRMAGVTAPPVEFDGEDLTPAFSGRPMKRRKDLFWEYGRDASYAYPGKSWDKSPNLAMRSGPWKLLINVDGSQAELYNIDESSVEEANVAKNHGDIAEHMKKELLSWRRSLPVLEASR